MARIVDGTLEAGWLYNGSGRPVAQLDDTGAVVARFAYPTGGLAPDFMQRRRSWLRQRRPEIAAARRGRF